MPKVRMLDVRNSRVIDPALELARKDDVIRELQEAAEFEARVAAKLAKAYELLSSNCEGYEFDPCSFCRTNVVKTLSCMSSCAATILRRMRIEVEEEMNDDKLDG